MKCLVVGANGFVGRAAASALRGEGHEVARVVGSSGAPADGLTRVYADGIYREMAAEIGATDLVVYAAGRSLPRGTLSLEEAIRADCKPFEDLLEVVATSLHPATVLLVSSAGAVYGETPSGARLAEDAPLMPVSTYGVTRLRMEQRLQSCARRSRMNGVVFRVSNLYGPGQAAGSGSGFILNVLQAALRGKPFTLMGTGRQQKDFLYIDDLAQAIRCVPGLMAREAPRERVYNVCAGASYSLLEVLDTIEQVIGSKVPLIHVESHAEDVQHVQLSNARAAAELGWQSRVTLREGIARTWKWVNESA